MSKRPHTVNPALITRRRIRVTALAFLLFLVFLFCSLFRLQILSSAAYREKVLDEVTVGSVLRAERGRILDRNGNVLAGSGTVFRVFVSTREIREKSEKTGTDVARTVAAGLADALRIPEETLYRKISGKGVLDVTLASAVSEETHRKVLAAIESLDLFGIVGTEAQNARNYPYGTMFAHVLGFTGSDNQGLYGLEYSYNHILSGKNGYYLYAKDASGHTLPDRFASTVPPIAGMDLVTTLDVTVQKELEEQLERIRVTHDVENRVTGIVMDVATGGILAMATSSPFDPNDPYELDSLSAEKLADSGFAEGSDEYRALKKQLLEVMWSNKAVSETYEPGSTFKIVTVSAALNSGVAKVSDTFSCHGYYEVGGWRIRCHKAGGHGAGFDLAYGLQMSCNPTMMQIAERLGSDAFYDYVDAFGYLEKTGIDLPSEASTIFHKKTNIGPTELATASFGQRFKVTVIGQLCAVAAIANGGKTVTPHLMEKIVDPSGNTVKTYVQPEGRQVVSEEVARVVSEILEAGVSGSGGAKNAYVPGYKVAAKTGTSQKFDVLDANGNSYLRIGSTVAYAPSDGRGIAVIIVVDEPMSTVKYGSTVAAPYVSAVLSEVLPYLDYPENSPSGEITVDSLVGLRVSSAEEKLRPLNIDVRIVGDGDLVTGQMPPAGETVTSKLSKIVLYTADSAPGMTEVPSLVGLDGFDANRAVTDAGLNLRILGVNPESMAGVRVVGQSIAPGECVPLGTVVTLTVLSDEFDE